MYGFPTTHWPPPPVLGSESNQQRTSPAGLQATGLHDYQHPQRQQQQPQETFVLHGTQPFQESSYTGAAPSEHDDGSGVGWRGLVAAANEVEQQQQQQQHDGSAWRKASSDQQEYQHQQLPSFEAYRNSPHEPSMALEATRPPPGPAPRPLFDGGGPGPPEDYRVAFANLQRKQIELRLAEEHRRSREAELEILRLREMEHRRSSQGTSAYGISARSSYSSGVAPVGFGVFPTPNMMPGQPAPHFDIVSTSTPSSTGSYSHSHLISDEQESGASGAYQSYASPLSVPLPPSPALHQDRVLFPPPPPGIYGIVPPTSFGFAPSNADGGLVGPHDGRVDITNSRSSPPSPPRYDQRPSYSYHSPAGTTGPYPPPPPSAFAQREDQPGSSFSGPDLQGFYSVPPPLPAQPLMTTRPPSPPPSKSKSSKRAARAVSPKNPAADKGTVKVPTTSPSTLPTSAAVNSSSSKKKRQLLQQQPTACCSLCAAPIAHLLLRGEDAHFKVDWEGVWVCKPCMGDDVAIEDAGRRRKRTRDTQDLRAPLTCDVCLQLKGKGGIIAKDSKSAILFSTEFVCVGCDAKYQRCTDCGGGGGGRIGIGKWRSRELFPAGRKTCSLAHTRIGSAPLTFGVWDGRELNDVAIRESLLERCEALWRDKLLTRLAIPEVLECGAVPERSFNDIWAALDEGWPSRQILFESPEMPYNEERRRYFGLTWCKTKPRRQAAAGEQVTEESPSTNDAVPDVHDPDSLSRTDIIPPNHELVGLFVGHWAMNDGTLLITTSLPFESTDGDDRNALAIGEMACRIVLEIDQINARRKSEHQSGHGPTSLVLLPPLEHLWVVCDSADPVVRERMRDLLNRRRQFEALDDYVRLHPHVDPAIFRVQTDPVSSDRPGWIMGGVVKAEDCEVHVRWLGPHFDRQTLDAIAGTEFSKRMKAKKPAAKP